MSAHFVSAKALSPAESSTVIALEFIHDNVLKVQISLDKTALQTSHNLAELVVLPQTGIAPQSCSEQHIASSALRLERVGKMLVLSTLQGEELLSLADSIIQPQADGEQHIQQQFLSAGEQAFYGLGQYPDGIFNYHNQGREICQSNKGIAAPMLLSSKGYAVLWNQLSFTEFASQGEAFSFSSEAGECIEFYLIYGPEFDHIIQHYRELTGAAPLFGRWAYGYWQSKERYVNAEDLLATAQTYRDKNIPIDNIVQDWKYWGELGWSAMQFDKAAFGDGASTIARLHDMNFKLMVSIWPIVGKDSPVFNELLEQGYLFETEHWANGHVYDAYSQQGRDIYWKHVKQGLMDLGGDALWMDGTEPEFISTQQPKDGVEFCYQQRDTALGSWKKVLNGYSLMTTRGVYEAQRQQISQGAEDKRVFTLSRSSYLGQQRYAAACWSGDISATWQVLRQQIPAGLNLCAAGLPYWTTDIGGFFTSGFGANFPEGVDDDAYKELYVRWFQYGAFCPLFRSHGANTPREIYQFGEPGDWAFDALLKFDKLRYRLLPYIYSQAWRVTQQGGTMMRLLAFDFRQQNQLHDISDQFMFGDSLMVCPVTQAMFHQQNLQQQLIAPEQLTTTSGHIGVIEQHFSDDAFKHFVSEKTSETLDGNWAGGPPAGLPLSGYSVRWLGLLTAPVDGEYDWLIHANDGVRFYLDDQLIIDSWQSQAQVNHKAKSQLQAGRQYSLRVEYAHWQGSSKCSLSWAHSGLSQQSTELFPAERDVVLPAGVAWYNYWNKHCYQGGQTLAMGTPIDIMPLLVKAGAIIPHGPDVQYHDELPCDPLTIEVYAGADGQFTLYEDEGDSYRYEQGEYSEIDYIWHDSVASLEVGERRGSFAGMLAKRTLVIRFVSAHSVQQQTVSYDGQSLSIQC
ncbi:MULTISPECIES: TIM-barrel domain-containing protein [unclassified Agarivorans]|uniref:TIM-barrel domain-containing protein n=1 Tax=unclassified Agarivorans TaxID=2636026 RepID=UPI0026E251DB|nr:MULTISPECIES: TIM-barrel domain-containing protein [unclassified Agarivorans]MDO6685206.1 glycoside hydrolase family 31 protein [Agarivorans sp. 3_MG-2023]MDO6715622.1 glycoside hydrolase family 31 protein [Agarivorans sp. 2_MG-2023]